MANASLSYGKTGGPYLVFPLSPCLPCLPPSSIPYVQYTVTATPVNGGAPVTLTVSSPSATLSGLAPGTQYRVTVAGKLANGQSSAASPPVLMTMPASGWVP